MGVTGCFLGNKVAPVEKPYLKSLKSNNPGKVTFMGWIEAGVLSGLIETNSQGSFQRNTHFPRFVQIFLLKLYDNHNVLLPFILCVSYARCD